MRVLWIVVLLLSALILVFALYWHKRSHIPHLGMTTTKAIESAYDPRNIYTCPHPDIIMRYRDDPHSWTLGKLHWQVTVKHGEPLMPLDLWQVTIVKHANHLYCDYHWQTAKIAGAGEWLRVTLLLPNRIKPLAYGGSWHRSNETLTCKKSYTDCKFKLEVVAPNLDITHIR